MRTLKSAIVFSLFVSLPSFHCLAQEFKVAAAADLEFAMQEVAAKFQQQTGKTVIAIYGSSGSFFQQLQNGAPFDMFFSASVDYPKRLESAGLIVPDSYYGYARGKIVLWVPNGSKLDLSRGLRILLDRGVNKVAIANPQHAPYGQAAIAALKKENLYDQVASKFVLGENISQTSSFVVSGAADVGIIALSLAMSPNLKTRGHYVAIPDGDYPPIEQACVILKSASHPELAREFLDFVKRPETRSIFRSYGFDVPDSLSAH
jgi:molybdate transport system substrate-binding protein